MARGYKTGGRKQGTPNKMTVEIRDIYKKLIEKNLSNIEDWLQVVSKENPEKALNILIKLSEFVIPKLQSTKLSSKIDFNEYSEQEINNLIDKINESK